MISYNYGQGPWFCTDASSSGYGVSANRDWMAGFFNDSATDNYPEFIDNLGLDESHHPWLNVNPHYVNVIIM